MADKVRHLRGSAARLTALVLAGAGLAGSARAQYATSIPFAPYSSPYRTFSYPTVTNYSLPNQARLQAFGTGLGGGTALDLPPSPDLFSLDPYGTMSRPTGGRFTPYHAAFRTPNRFESQYTQRDQEFAENQARREELYFQLRTEQDPKRRAEMTKELEEVNEALRKAGTSGRRSAAPRSDSRSTPAASSGRRTSRGTSVAVPPLPTTGPNGIGTSSSARPPATPPAASDRSPTGDRPESATPPAGPVIPPSGARDVDPLEVLERSRRLDAASGMGSSAFNGANPPLGGPGLTSAGGRGSSAFGSSGAFSGAPRPSTSRARGPLSGSRVRPDAGGSPTRPRTGR